MQKEGKKTRSPRHYVPSEDVNYRLCEEAVEADAAVSCIILIPLQILWSDSLSF